MSVLLLFFLSILQGITELFPVSSLGHTLILPALCHVYLDKHTPALVPFLVALHMGTALALLWYFRMRWMALLRGWLGSFRGQHSDDGHLAWALIVGTIPAGLVGLLLEKLLERVFQDVRIVSIALIANGLLLFLGQYFQQRANQITPQRLGLGRAAVVGLAQIGALIPGFSRSGLTMIAGLSVGLSAASAAEFSFLLGTPIIFAASVLELPKLFLYKGLHLSQAVWGGLLTAIAAYLSVRFLMRYFEGRGRLAWFGIYCIVLGACSLTWFIIRP